MSCKVLHIVGKMDRGGAETFVMNIYRNIDREAFKFDFLVHDKVQAKQDYSEEIKELGGKIFYISPISHFVRYLLDLYSFFKKSNHDVVHIHTYVQALFPLLFAKYFGKKVIVHSHSTQFTGHFFIKIIKYLLTRPLGRLSDYNCACGREAGEWLFGKSIAKKQNYSIIINGINTNTFRYNEALRNEYREKLKFENKLVCGHVGRFEAQKNHRFLIDIFHQIHKKNRDAVLLLIGRGTLEDEIKDKVNKLGLTSVVYFLGVRSDIVALMNAMDILVFPSLHEGLPVTLVEAQATGLPCLVSDTVSEEAKITKLCKFIPLNDINQWVKTCLAKQPERNDTLAQIDKAGYSISSSVEKLHNIYLYLLRTNK